LKPSPRAFLALLVFGVLAVGSLLWWLWPPELSLGGDNTMEDVVAHSRACGPWTTRGSIVLMVVHSFLPFPSELITLANDMEFEP